MAQLAFNLIAAHSRNFFSNQKIGSLGSNGLNLRKVGFLDSVDRNCGCAHAENLKHWCQQKYKKSREKRLEPEIVSSETPVRPCNSQPKKKGTRNPEHQ